MRWDQIDSIRKMAWLTEVKITDLCLHEVCTCQSLSQATFFQNPMMHPGMNHCEASLSGRDSLHSYRLKLNHPVQAGQAGWHAKKQALKNTLPVLLTEFKIATQIDVQ